MKHRGVGAKVAGRMAGLRADVTFAALDTAFIIASYALVIALAGSGTRPVRVHLMAILAAAVVAHLLANAAFGLYGRMWRYASIEEARHLAEAAICAGGLLAVVSVSHLIRIRPGLIVLGPVVATCFLGASRFRARLFAWQRGGSAAPGGVRMAVIGTDRHASALIRYLRGVPQYGYEPVLILDDDPRSHGQRLHGVPIVGSVADLPLLAPQYGIGQVLLAIPGAAPDVVDMAARAAQAAKLPLRLLPMLAGHVDGPAALGSIRQVRIEDLLGRKEVATDRDGVRALIQGGRVLVTGGGGSIGSELVRQLAELDPASLVILDHDETHLFEAAAQVRGILGDRCVEVLADIRDREDMLAVFQTYRPEFVFHAAAHKHVPMLERFPLEAARTNVLGTANVVDAAASVHVKRFVFISTDKAVRPRSMLGATKWIGEQIVSERRGETGSYCCVRFGNVLGSRGSVVPTFQRQIEAGGPVTVTSPEMTRYFMSVEEAVQLVLQAALLTERCDLFMLEMGSPVRIVDLARRMIELADRGQGDIPIVFTGTRAGEKQHEELYDPTEEVLATEHPSISRLVPSVLPSAMLEDGLSRLREAVVTRQAAEIAPLIFEVVAWAQATTTGESITIPPQGAAGNTDRTPRTVVLPDAAQRTSYAGRADPNGEPPSWTR